VVISGGPGEEDLARAVAATARVPALTGLPLTGLAGLVARSRLVICGDTGVAHLASAYARPSVVLFGPVSPAVWGPPDHPRHEVLWHGDGTGDPHGARPDPALLRISVAEVAAAIDRALAGEARARQASGA
jgi:ADP-heptose:LPS heptosyltransferase